MTGRSGPSSIGWLSMVICILIAIYIPQYSFKSKSERLLEYYIQHPTDDIVFAIPITLSTHEFKLPDIIKATEIQLKNELLEIQESELVNFRFDLRFNDEVKSPTEQEEEEEEEGAVMVTTASNETAPVDKFETQSHEIAFRLRDTEALYNDPAIKRSEFIFQEKSLFSNDFPYFLTQTILYQIFKDEMNRLRIENHNQTIIHPHRDTLVLKVVMYDEVIDIDEIKRALTFDNDLARVYENIEINIMTRSELEQFQQQQQQEQENFLEQSQQNIHYRNITIRSTRDEYKEPKLKKESITVYLEHQLFKNDEDERSGGGVVIANVEQMVLDIKGKLLDTLWFLDNPQVVPLRIEMELRYRTLINLLNFIQLLQDSSLESHKDNDEDDKVMDLFRKRSKIIHLLSDEYDWDQAYNLSKQLIKEVSNL